MSFWLYILQSQATSRFYIGQTQDIEKRLAYHNANYSKALKNRGPWRLVHSEEYATRSEAMLRERQIKSWKDHAMIARLVSASRSSPGRSWVRIPSAPPNSKGSGPETWVTDRSGDIGNIFGSKGFSDRLQDSFE